MAAKLGALGDFSMEGLCSSILDRHRAAIRVKKPKIAVKKISRIIEAILVLSNRKGFHATSLREISSTSGLSMGSLYSYFDSKDTLLMMILGQVAEATTTVLASAPKEVTDDPVIHLRWLIELHVALTETMLPWFVFAFLEAKSFPPAGRKAAVESEEATEAIFRSVLQRGVQQGCFADVDPAFVAAILKPLLQDWYVKRSKWRRRNIDANEYVARLQEFVERALLD